MFDKMAIANSKVGVHKIVFSPGTTPQVVKVEKVRGDFVWVWVGKKTVRLNATASRKLILDHYR